MNYNIQIIVILKISTVFFQQRPWIIETIIVIVFAVSGHWSHMFSAKLRLQQWKLSLLFF